MAAISCELGIEEEDPLVITTVTDISVQSETMESLHRSEERFSKAFNLIPLTLIIGRLSDGMVLEAHTAPNNPEEIDVEAIKGKTAIDGPLWPSAHARTLFVERLVRDGHITGMDAQLRGSRGKLFDARIWAQRIEIDGEDCVLSCIVNTTLERQREAQLRELASVMSNHTETPLLQDLTQHIATSVGADIVLIGSIEDNDRVQTLAVWKDGQVARNFNCAIQDTPCEEAMSTNGLCSYASNVSQIFLKDPMLDYAGVQAYVGKALRSHQSEHIGVLAVMWRKPIELTTEMQSMISICAARANAELQRVRHESKILDLNTHLEKRGFSAPPSWKNSTWSLILLPTRFHTI